MMNFVIPLAIVATVLFICWRLVCPKEDPGKEITQSEFAADITKFIDGSATAKDSDEIYTFSLADPKMEQIRYEVLDILDRFPSSKSSGWCNDQGIAELQRIREALLADATEPNQRATDNDGAAPRRV